MPVAGLGRVPLAAVEPLGHVLHHGPRLVGRVLQGGARAAQIHRRPDQHIDGDADQCAEGGLADPGGGGQHADGRAGEDEEGAGRRVDALAAQAPPVAQQDGGGEHHGHREQRVVQGEGEGRGDDGSGGDRGELLQPVRDRAVHRRLDEDDGDPGGDEGDGCVQPPAGGEPGEEGGEGRLERLHDQVAFAAGSRPCAVGGEDPGPHLPMDGLRRLSVPVHGRSGATLRAPDACPLRGKRVGSLTYAGTAPEASDMRGSAPGAASGLRPNPQGGSAPWTPG